VVEINNGEPVFVKKKEDLYTRVEDSEDYPTPSVCCDWEAEEASLYDTLDDALAHLENKEKRLIRARLGYDGKEMKFHEIADEYGVSTQAVHKRYNSTVSKLRTFIEDANASYAMCA
jgi:RNA polymerase sigma factor (sigma-70 family)